MPTTRSQARDGPWYLFDINEFHRVTRCLSTHLIGAYVSLCHHVVFVHDEQPVPNNAKSLGRLFNCSARKAEEIIQDLRFERMIARQPEDLVIPSHLGFITYPKRSIPRRVRQAVFDRDGFVCTYCSDEEGPFDLDHVHPSSRGGLSTEANLTVACASCNRSKGASTLDEWKHRQNEREG
jgi:hypothetical protein